MNPIVRVRSPFLAGLFVAVPVVVAVAAACAPRPREEAPVGVSVQAALAPGLGTAESFAVLAGSTVTNTGPSVVHGDLGVSPGAAVTGFPPGLVTGGTVETATAVALQAQSDATTAYNALAGQACDVDPGV